MACRFFGFSIDDVMKLTLRQFGMVLKEMTIIMAMENGTEDKDKEVPLEGDVGFEAIKRMLPKGRRGM